jgi:hypothetical protein
MHYCHFLFLAKINYDYQGFHMEKVHWFLVSPHTCEISKFGNPFHPTVFSGCVFSNGKKPSSNARSIGNLGISWI